MAVEFALLRLLRKRPSHGYELRKELFAMRNVFPFNNVNVYPVLRELEAKGYAVVSHEVVAERMRCTYEITNLGCHALDRWVESDHDPGLPAGRDLASLKLLLAVKQSERLEWLSTEITAAEAELERLESFSASSDADLLPLARLTAREQVSLAHRRVAFLYDVQQILEASADRPVDGADLESEIGMGSPSELEQVR